ncbi:capsule biosynthesis protein [Stappia indica]|uniref:capsule biosynthesis protein n=1 Tax=Stappia indica TaxID=538381 RepID=UPI001CD4276D|nr:capsular biosynthesis protein [Stappia indica]MCA1297389.1 capsular biosynthesis protein [Stappia indica]
MSPLFRRIGARLAEAGHEVRRINFCPGDWLHWHGRGTGSYRGTSAQWPTFIAGYLAEHRITDLVVHGDTRPYHRAAVRATEELGISVVCTELGYLRPGWMTIERGGLSTLSRFPDSADAIRAAARAVGTIDLAPRYPGSFVLEAWQDVSYHLPNVFLGFLYPGYRRHTPLHPVVDYSRWLLRLAGARRRKARAVQRQKALAEGNGPLFLLPLQVEGDYQILAHSPFATMAEALERIMISFAAHAPADARLVVKSHPLDNGHRDWQRCVTSLATRLGRPDAVTFLDGGTLPDLLRRAAGLVTVNSSAGLEALRAGVPVKTMTPALYDVAGLTHQGELDGFWSAPEPPDSALVADVVTAIAACLQVRGSIHNSAGLDAAVDGMAARILSHTLNAPADPVEPPPRLARARALGVGL